MATTKSSSPAKSTSPKTNEAATSQMVAAGSIELARISAILLAALLAVMTFLLSAGLQHPKIGFNIFFYLALGTLALNLVLYAGGNLLTDDALSAAASRRVQGWYRAVQQVAFIASILAVTGFVIVASMLFFAAPTAGSSGAAAQQSSGA